MSKSELTLAGNCSREDEPGATGIEKAQRKEKKRKREAEGPQNEIYEVARLAQADVRAVAGLDSCLA
jgi:hypothetical protein